MQHFDNQSVMASVVWAPTLQPSIHVTSYFSHFHKDSLYTVVRMLLSRGQEVKLSKYFCQENNFCCITYGAGDSTLQV